MAAPALVSAGTINRTTTTTNQPAFGQATTSGNFLAAYVSFQGSATLTAGITTTSSGWSFRSTAFNGTAANGWFYKSPASAGETAPTFNAPSGATTVFFDAVLLEISGITTATGGNAPYDQFSGTQATIGGSLGTADATNQDIFLAGQTCICSKSATYTASRSWGPSGGTEANYQDNSATKSTMFTAVGAYLLNGFGGGTGDSFSLSLTPSTGSFVTNLCSVESLKAADGNKSTGVHGPPISTNLQAITRSYFW